MATIKQIKIPKGNSAETYDLAVKVNNVEGLLDGNKIDPDLLPSYVDDIVEGYYKDSTHFYDDSAFTTPITGEKGKIYADLSTDGSLYRWSGSLFVEIVDMPDMTVYYTKNDVDALLAQKTQVQIITWGDND